MRSGEITDLEGPFAAVVFWHSLEHLRAPADTLREAVDRLLPGGVVVLSLPNSASWQSRAFGERWFALDVPRHLVHLPAPAVLRRLGELGLGIERTSYIRGGQVVFGWLHGFVGTLPGRPDLYAAIRRPEARQDQLSPATRVAALATATALLPAATAAAGAEAAAHRGGTVYVEARK